jgi:hypothetical protein
MELEVSLIALDRVYHVVYNVGERGTDGWQR